MIRMPWSKIYSPNIVLEINSKCNISCNGCYKKLNGATKPVEQIMKELDFALTQRKIQTVSIAGGEPTLHPNLCEIIKSIKSRNLRSLLLTNGLELNNSYLKRLKTSGLDLIMLHVDQGQRRPDLPFGSEIDSVLSLLTDISSKIAANGIEAGFSATIHLERTEELMLTVDYLINSKNLNFFLATNYFDVEHAGNLSAKKTNNENVKLVPDKNTRISGKIKERFGLLPYSYLPSDHPELWGEGNWPWILYLMATVKTKNGSHSYFMQSNRIDRILLKAVNFFNKRPVLYSGQNSFLTSVRVLINMITSFRVIEGIRFFAKAVCSRSPVKSKAMIFENGPVQNENGNYSCTEFCTNPTVRDGKLVPICQVDHFQCESKINEN